MLPSFYSLKQCLLSLKKERILNSMILGGQGWVLERFWEASGWIRGGGSGEILKALRGSVVDSINSGWIL